MTRLLSVVAVREAELRSDVAKAAGAATGAQQEAKRTAQMCGRLAAGVRGVEALDFGRFRGFSVPFPRVFGGFSMRRFSSFWPKIQSPNARRRSQTQDETPGDLGAQGPMARGPRE